MFLMNIYTMSNHNKTKKCQPVARDTPDLIQTECVPDNGLARQKNKQNEKIKNRKRNYSRNVTLVEEKQHNKK